jgi:predicted DsbA family dithiol-disulfide isomerase
MKIDIWSDVRCPFCYIGKRKFETALESFPAKDKVEVTWKSFQLDPALETRQGEDIFSYFTRAKGVSREQAEEMFSNVTGIAKEVGLEFNIPASVLANSFNAHRLIQLAKAKGLGSQSEEALFRIHFIEGKDINDKNTLLETGVSIGLDQSEVKAMLDSTAYTDEVRRDEEAAQAIGVRGVPFFVFNDKYAVSGAQSPETFLQVLEKSWSEYEPNKSNLQIIKGQSCDTDGECK